MEKKCRDLKIYLSIVIFLPIKLQIPFIWALLDNWNEIVRIGYEIPLFTQKLRNITSLFQGWCLVFDLKLTIFTSKLAQFHFIFRLRVNQKRYFIDFLTLKRKQAPNMSLDNQKTSNFYWTYQINEYFHNPPLDCFRTANAVSNWTMLLWFSRGNKKKLQ